MVWWLVLGMGMGVEVEYGWKVKGEEEDRGGGCDLRRVRLEDLTREIFEVEFAWLEPVVIVGVGRERNGVFREHCAREKILEEWGDSVIVLSTANTQSYEKRRSTLKDYIRDVVDAPPPPPGTKGSKQWYWFGDNDHHAWSSFFDLYTLPPFVHPSTVALSFGIGAPHSGVPFHIHGRVFAETLIGRKRWLLTPPHSPPNFDGDQSTSDWITSYFASSPPHPNHNIIDCTVHQTEILYIPPNWYHATLNLDQTVFISTFIDDTPPPPSTTKIDL